MILILKTEEDFARYQRRLCPDLPDNIVEDELAGNICTDLQLTRQAIRAIRKMSEDEKCIIRESMRWDLYDRKLKRDVIH